VSAPTDETRLAMTIADRDDLAAKLATSRIRERAARSSLDQMTARAQALRGSYNIVVRRCAMYVLGELR